jgi:photosystem II stability/assembly factor-like uncharacterized protein
MREKPGGKILLIVISLLLTAAAIAGHAGAALNTWQSNGPTGSAGSRIWGLTIDPNNHSVLYAGTSGGLYKSSNAGDSWELNTGLVATVVYTITVNPANSQIIYVGMPDGVHMSTNGGTSWDLLSTGIPASTAIKSIVIDPSDLTTLYVATYSKGVYKSTHGGAWGQVNTNLTDLDVTALVIDPQTPATLYAGTYCGGVFKGTYGGTSWTEKNVGLTDKCVMTLAIDPLTPETIYAGTYFDGVFRSTNGGDSWEAVNSGLSNAYIQSLAVNPQHTGILYAGISSNGVFKGSGGSVHWIPVNTGLTTNYVNALAVDPVSPATVYAGTDGGGVFKVTFGNVTLNTDISGTGRGTVTSDPSGMACGADCSHPFEFGTYVTLTGVPFDFSDFSGWSGPCIGTSWCGLTMNTDQTVGAAFNPDTTHKAQIQWLSQGIYYSTLQAAYDAADSTLPILAWGTDFTEDLEADDPGNKAVTIKGGYNDAYETNNGYTTLHGTLTIAKGSLTLERLAIR